MADWQTLSSRVVHETAWIKLKEDKVLNQNGKELTYTFLEQQKPSVFIVALNDQDEVLLQSTYRYTLNKRIWEIPAGFIEQGEQPIVAAMRELDEETGLQSEDWQDLGTLNQIIGIGIAPLHVILARNVTSKGDPTDKDEDITDRKFMTLQQVDDMIRTGELFDSPVIAAIYKARLTMEAI